MEDYVTKKEFNEGLQNMKTEIVTEIVTEVTEKVTENVLRGVGGMFEHLEGQISAMAEMLAPTMTKASGNEEKIEINRIAINENKSVIASLAS